MAVNTASKRRSVSGLPFLPLGPSVPVPAAPAATRQAAGWGYVGIPVWMPGGTVRPAAWLAGNSTGWLSQQPPPGGWLAGDS